MCHQPVGRPAPEEEADHEHRVVHGNDACDPPAGIIEQVSDPPRSLGVRPEGARQEEGAEAEEEPDAHGTGLLQPQAVGMTRDDDEQRATANPVERGDVVTEWGESRAAEPRLESTS